MDQFYSLLCNCWRGDSFDESKMDIIINLPPEIAIMILRLLDPRALLAAILISRKWVRLIRSDCVLRRRVREELVKEREARWNVLYEVIPPAPRRSRFLFGPKTNRVQSSPDNTVPTHSPASRQPQQASSRQPQPRQQPLTSIAARQLSAVHSREHEMSLPQQSYENAPVPKPRSSAHPASRTRVSFTQTQPAVHTHARVFEDSREFSTTKAAKYRPSKKLIVNKNRPTSLRL